MLWREPTALAAAPSKLPCTNTSARADARARASLDKSTSLHLSAKSGSFGFCAIYSSEWCGENLEGKHPLSLSLSSARRADDDELFCETPLPTQEWARCARRGVVRERRVERGGARRGRAVVGRRETAESQLLGVLSRREPPTPNDRPRFAFRSLLITQSFSPHNSVFFRPTIRM